MLRGKKKFICRDCGEKFSAPDLEWKATSLSAPQPCPKCSSMKTRPVGLIPWVEDAKYRKVWGGVIEKQIDQISINLKILKSMDAYLFQSNKGVKILYVYDEDSKNVFDASCPFVSKISNDISFVEEFSCCDFWNLLESIKPDLLLSSPKIDNLLSEEKASKVFKKYCDFGLLNVSNKMCVYVENVDRNELKKYYSLFLLIGQIKSIQNELSD